MIETGGTRHESSEESQNTEKNLKNKFNHTKPHTRELRTFTDTKLMIFTLQHNCVITPHVYLNYNSINLTMTSYF